jgi:hypothetical protein
MSIQAALVAAERLLPAADGTEDPRWQAIIEVDLFAKQEPEAIWPFVMKWGSHDEDLRSASRPACSNTSWNIILICYFHGRDRCKSKHLVCKDYSAVLEIRSSYRADASRKIRSTMLRDSLRVCLVFGISLFGRVAKHCAARFTF